MLNSFVLFDWFLAVLELGEILWAQAASYVAAEYFIEIIKSKVEYRKRNVKLHDNYRSNT